MRERDVHNLIEQQNPEAKRRIWERISSQLDLTPAEPQPKKPVKKKRWSWAFIAMAVVCVVTLSIVLPITLRGNDDVVDEPQIRFCDSNSYTVDSLGQTLKEYSSEHNKNFLYVDWYDISEETTTRYAFITEDKTDIVFWEEMFINGETGEELTISITDNKTKVDKFEEFEKKYNEIEVNKIKVKLKTNNTQSSMASFEYNNYNYYLNIEFGDGQERMVEIIESMLK